MPKIPRITAKEAGKLLTKAGFRLNRVKGNHYIFTKGIERLVIPFHAGKILHPKIVKQVMEAIDTGE